MLPPTNEQIRIASAAGLQVVDVQRAYAGAPSPYRDTVAVAAAQLKLEGPPLPSREMPDQLAPTFNPTPGTDARTLTTAEFRQSLVDRREALRDPGPGFSAIDALKMPLDPGMSKAQVKAARELVRSKLRGSF